jgi:ubiquinone/menaquinone biosynthesis C-methylase UbiE
MNQQQNEIREQQRLSWNRFSLGWKKWDEFHMNFLRPMGDDIALLLDPLPSDQILDVATGTGEPGLTLAAKVPSGKVIGIDISDGMVNVAMENAVARGLQNFHAVTGDTCELPFPDNSFDQVSCRMGFMFFPDMLLAATEMFRVLRPGGHIATCVWAGPEHNTWVTPILNSLKKFVNMPPPGTPTMFRCAAKGFMTDLLQTAGFFSVKDKKIKGQVRYDSPERYWTIMNEIVAPLFSPMEGLNEEVSLSIKHDLFRTLDYHQGNGGLTLSYEAIMLYGKK